jgi:addiction module HigA family antidote
MIPTHRVSTHPGIILIKEFLEPLGLSQTALAEHLGISVQRVNEIVRGKRGITPETAWLFAKAFNMSPEFWLNLQSAHDLSSHRLLVEISPLVSASA